MRAMILCAGRGERMRPLTDALPKPLLRVGGRPLVEWTIARLATAGVRDIIVNHAHLGHCIEATLGDGARLGVAIRYSAEGEALETAGGIATALPLLGERPFIVANGDVWSDFDFAGLVAHPASLDFAPDILAHLVLVPNPPHHRQGDFALEAGRVSLQGDERFTYAGLGLYRPELFASTPAGARAKLAPLLTAAAARGAVTGEIHRGRWEDVGTPERLGALDRSLRA